MRAILVLIVAFLVSCNTYPPPEWPSPYEDQVWRGANGKPVIMDKAPIFVYADPVVSVLAQNAVDTWNGWLGFELLRFTPVPTRADVLVMKMTRPIHSLAGITLAYTNGKRVVLLNSLTADTTVHEFGHVLGLGHDENNMHSIMYPTDQRLALAQLEARDLVLLRKYYAPLYETTATP